jgi:hypothetical protein
VTPLTFRILHSNVPTLKGWHQSRKLPRPSRTAPLKTNVSGSELNLTTSAMCEDRMGHLSRRRSVYHCRHKLFGICRPGKSVRSSRTNKYRENFPWRLVNSARSTWSGLCLGVLDQPHLTVTGCYEYLWNKRPLVFNKHRARPGRIL